MNEIQLCVIKDASLHCNAGDRKQVNKKLTDFTKN